MSAEQFLHFMKNEQKEVIPIEEGQEIVKNFESSEDKVSFTKEGFTHFLMFNEWQELVSPRIKNRIESDNMKHPLSHYWIASSHNT